jgi:hypothetical protein
LNNCGDCKDTKYSVELSIDNSKYSEQDISTILKSIHLLNYTQLQSTLIAERILNSSKYELYIGTKEGCMKIIDSFVGKQGINLKLINKSLNIFK